MQRSLRTCHPQLPPLCGSFHCRCFRSTCCSASSLICARPCMSLLELYRTTHTIVTMSERLKSTQGSGSHVKHHDRRVGQTPAASTDPPTASRSSDASKGGGCASIAKQVTTTVPCVSSSSQTSTPETSGCDIGERVGRTFSQGLTDFCWRESVAHKDVFVPSVLRAESAKNRIRLFGMPKGFPGTTAVGFRRFFYLSQVNSFIADFSACIGYQSLLSGFFLGSSPQMWVLKDLFPALIAAYMANRVVSYENRPKQWFCVSVLLRNVTIVSDMIIPSAIPSHMVLAAVVNAVLKQSSALMFFISRAAALQHYAIDNNLAELTKKFNSFSMVTFTLATALAIVYCTSFTSFTAQLTTILVCCVVNMVLSYMAYYPIAFRILNFNTIHVLLHTYVRDPSRGVMTPQEVSNLMGLRMSSTSTLRGDPSAAAELATHLLYISPPIDKLLIRSDRLQEDVLYRHSNGAFLLAMWRSSAVPLTLRESWLRYELPTLPCFLRDGLWWKRRNHSLVEMERRFHGHRLCFLVQHQCTPKELVTAYLLMYTAVLQHASSDENLRFFIRQCHATQEEWSARGEALYHQLKSANWDVELPALDHYDFRVSQLLVKHLTADGNAADLERGPR